MSRSMRSSTQESEAARRDLAGFGVGADRGGRSHVRILITLILLGGCSLYFNESSSPPSGDDHPPGDPPPPPPPSSGPVAVVRCEDGVLRRVQVPDFAPTQPGHGAGTTVGQCAGACQSAAFVCPNGNCDGAESALCATAQSVGASCDLEGTACTGGSIECPATTTCGASLAASACTCSGGVYACTPHGPMATIQQQLVGKWVGTVHPPNFSDDYEVSMWIYPDGTYWAECNAPDCLAFYYGGDGPYPDRTISILATSESAGAWANIGIYFGFSPPNVGNIESLTVSDTQLRFTFNASWLTCAQPFFFNLTRAP